MEVLDAPVTNARWKPLWLLFGDLKSKNAFQRWIARYQTWFGERDMDQQYFPEIPRSGRHALTFCEIPSGLKLCPLSLDFVFPDGSVERWAWVLQNCRKPVYVTPDGLGFVSSKDAVHFKLKWC
jgi:hypothetical protein